MADDKKSVEIRNFLGEKRVRNVPMLEGVTVEESKNQKDQFLIRACSLSSPSRELSAAAARAYHVNLFAVGNDIETVSQSAADIHTSCLVKNKDIRKVSQKSGLV